MHVRPESMCTGVTPRFNVGSQLRVLVNPGTEANTMNGPVVEPFIFGRV